MVLDLFCPLIREWFSWRFREPTEPQRLGWPEIYRGEDTLIAAPTGSGKTLAAFLVALDRLWKRALAGELHRAIQVVYVSPLRALSNDMHHNLWTPLNELSVIAQREGYTGAEIRAGLRTGDSTASERAALVRKPPHILVTTPESLFLLMTGKKSRLLMEQVETIIIDEVHALVRDKRGSHLSLTLEHLSHHCATRPQRIGMSATQRPIELTARFLVGAGDPLDGTLFERKEEEASKRGDLRPEDPAEYPTRIYESGMSRCAIVDVGHGRTLDLAIEVPPSELSAVCSYEQWAEAYEGIAKLVREHRSTLIFVNTRRMAERVSHQLASLLGEESVRSHHGSLSAVKRHETEQGLKSGKLRAVIATSSLELGLDVGYIDLVIQIGSPGSIAGFLQRVGRSGHALGLIPKGRLYALTRDELMECMALVRAVRQGRLDTVQMPIAPIDILAQQIVSIVAHQEWSVDELFNLVRRAEPYKNLSREDFERTLELLQSGIESGKGKSRVYVHFDRVGKRVRGRPGAALAACSSGGAIPEIATYRVIAEPDRVFVGTLDEDFSVESQAGDIFLLGNTSWRIKYVRGGEVVVTDAHGAPPSIPFWLGEAPGRTFELSREVSSLREELEKRVDLAEEAAEWLMKETSVSHEAARQIVLYCAAQKAAIGLLPTQNRLVFERFFDESGGMQLLIHAPFGARINRAWGLAMRKRFCRSFDFELQATADDDGVILSLGPQHSFALESMFKMLQRGNAQGLLEQAVLASPIFQTRWRWNIIRALFVMRQDKGKKVPPALQRFRSDDLLTAVFPAVTGCKEEVIGDIPLPDHILVRQTMEDCLFEAMDLTRLHGLLEQIDRGEIELIARDTREPSPFCYELLNANPYAFLDGGELQERRTRAVATRRTLTVEGVSDLGRLDPKAIAQVVEESQPVVRNNDELHDVLLARILLPIEEIGEWNEWKDELIQEGRAGLIRLEGGREYLVSAERWPAIEAAFQGIVSEPPLIPPPGIKGDWDDVTVRVAMLRGLIETSGPITATEAALRIGMRESQAAAGFEALEGEGVVLRGSFTPDRISAAAAFGPRPKQPAAASGGREPSDSSNKAAEIMPRPEQPATGKPEVEWCHRRLLARIHRLTLEGLRKQIEPVTVDVLMRFLFRFHGFLPGEPRTGTNGVFQTIAQLQGMDIPGVSWERDVLPYRVEKFRPEWIDELCLTGEVGWGRLYPSKRDPERSRPMASMTRVVPLSLFLRQDLDWLCRGSAPLDRTQLSSPAIQVLELLTAQGATFATDLARLADLLPSQMEDVLGELITFGFITADGFAGFRKLMEGKSGSEGKTGHRRRGVHRFRNPRVSTGRWSLWRTETTSEELVLPNEVVEQWAWQLLRRWGVVFRDLLERESGAPRWFELLGVYRKLEARGEIRGGRFITGVAGEQYALGETVRLLRVLRDQGPKGELHVVSAADPLNLIGIIEGRPRVPAHANNRIAYYDGVPIAAKVGGTLLELGPIPERLAGMIERRLNIPSTTEALVVRPQSDLNDA